MDNYQDTFERHDSEPWQDRFSVESFQFHTSSSIEIHFHCALRICMTGIDEHLCHKSCLGRRAGALAGAGKSGAPFMATREVVSGPIRIRWASRNQEPEIIWKVNSNWSLIADAVAIWVLHSDHRCCFYWLLQPCYVLWNKTVQTKIHHIQRHINMILAVEKIQLFDGPSCSSKNAAWLAKRSEALRTMQYFILV